MLRITIEIVPFGEEERKNTIAEITAALRPDSELPERGDYKIVVKERKFNNGNPALFETDSFVLKGHWRSEGAIKLVQSILLRMQGLALPFPDSTKDKLLARRERQQLAQKQGYNIREDGRVERICEHGVGHPVGHVNTERESEDWMWVHGCDGCCRDYERLNQSAKEAPDARIKL